MTLSSDSFLAKLLLSVIFIFIALLFAEVATRIYGKIKDIDFTLYMQELKNSNRLPEGTLEKSRQVLATTSDFSVIYKTNSKGLRDKEYSYIKPEDKIRILAFGDSYTFGEGVRYGRRFTDIAEDYFSGVEIINFGVPGVGLDNELIDFVKKGLKYSPDYVIIFINLTTIERYRTNIIKNGTITLEDIEFREPVSDASTLFLSRDDPLFNADNNRFTKKSYFLSFLNYQITLMRLKRRLKEQDKAIWGDIRKSSKTMEDPLAHKNYLNSIHNRAAIIIRKFNEICKENNIKLIIIKIGIGSDLSYLSNLDNNISYYDLTDGLKNERKKYRLSFKYDGHYNEKTHDYIGRKLIEILKDKVISEQKFPFLN
ncbi:SGNH/GDSL hydrolase family protein [Candidatus Omnitrophota bacterium]